MIKVGTTSISAIKVGTTEIKKVCVGSTEVYSSAPTPTLDWFYVENATNSANTLLIVKNNSNAPTLDIEYSTDKNAWSSLGQTSTTDLTYSIPANGKVYLRCKTSAWASSSSYFNHIKTSGNCNVGGNIMSLLSGRDFTGNETTLSADYTFYKLFDSSYVVSANNLSLPATTLSSWCYYAMFQSCTSLTSAPTTLPATTLTMGCYYSMFRVCRSLTTSPTLSATTLANSCYRDMFRQCWGLTTAPTLSATTLAEYCYSGMFQECISLTTAPALPADTLATYCYKDMFYDCTSLTTAPSLSATSLAVSCYQSMFRGCTSLTTAPTLPAMTIIDNCYYQMFYGCSSLNSITVGADVWDTGWSNGWLYGVAASGTLYNELGAPLPENNASGIPSGWTEVISDNIPFYLQDVSGSVNSVTLVKNNADAPTLTIEYSTSVLGPWTTLGNTDTTPLSVPIGSNGKTYLRCNASAWGNNVNSTNVANTFSTASGNFKVGGNALSLLYGSNFTGSETSFPSGSTYTFMNLFNNNTYLTSAKMLKLNATTLVDYCYDGMFRGCTSLTTPPTLPATTLVDYCYDGMFRDCTSLTAAPSLPATTLATNCYEGMFWGCSSLATAPTLPATTLAYGCYKHFLRETAITTAPALPATTLQGQCYSCMFRGCTALTTAPTLPATTLATECYYQMFYGCSSLNSVRIKATVWNVANASNWLNGVAASGTLYNDGNSNIPTSSTNGIPSGWTEVSDRNGYFYVENATNSANTLSIVKSSGNSPSVTVEYSTNKTTWSTLGTTSTTALTYSIPANSKVYLRSNATRWSTTAYYNKINCSGNFYVGGDVLSLLNGSNYANGTISADYAFAGLFYDARTLILATGLNLRFEHGNGCFSRMFYGCTSLTNVFYSLPSSNLTGYTEAYKSMFYNCSSLLVAPLLPATTLGDYCYAYMFFGCTSLTTAPALPATSLKYYCYQSMFYGCTGLTTAPELKASTLAKGCYASIFSGCSNLTSIKVAFTTWPNMTETTNTTYQATYQWTRGLPASGTFYKKSGLSTHKNASGNDTVSTTSISGATNAIPYNWTVTNY